MYIYIYIYIYAFNILLEKGSIDVDVTLIIDEIYSRRSCEHSRGVFVGRDENGEFYNSIMEKSIPSVNKSCSKTKIDGTWLFPQSIET